MFNFAVALCGFYLAFGFFPPSFSLSHSVLHSQKVKYCRETSEPYEYSFSSNLLSTGPSHRTITNMTISADGQAQPLGFGAIDLARSLE